MPPGQLRVVRLLATTDQLAKEAIDYLTRYMAGAVRDFQLDQGKNVHLLMSARRAIDAAMALNVHVIGHDLASYRQDHRDVWVLDEVRALLDGLQVVRAEVRERGRG